MKYILSLSILLSVLLVAGCNSDKREMVAPPPLATAPDPNASKIAAENQNNAKIEEQIHKTGKLPDGRTVPVRG